MHVRFPGRRVAAHAVALGAVTALVLTGTLPATPRVAAPVSAEPVVATDDAALPAWLEPAQRPLPVAPTPSAAARTQGADQTVAVTFNPRQGLPRWLRTVRAASLFSGSDAAASAFDSLPASTAFYVKPLGTFSDGRLDVYFPGDGDTRAPAQGWIDAAAVEPSGIPPWVATPSALPRVHPALVPQRTGDAAPPNVSAWYVAIVDDASGQLLYGEKPHEAVPQASTTKIATTIVALERAGDLSKRVKVSVSASAMTARDGSSTLGIEPGRTVALDTLLYGMMLPSGNDAAEQVALSLADSRAEFVGWMNDEAASLGLADTHFANPSGMDAAGHYSSAYDMAMLARYAMRNPTFRTLAGTVSYSGDGYPMHNLNRLLDYYPGADGVKIGYTDLAQKTIIASAVRDGHRVYVSLLHSADLVTDSIRMFDWVWNNYTWPDPTPAEPERSGEPGQLVE